MKAETICFCTTFISTYEYFWWCLSNLTEIMFLKTPKETIKGLKTLNKLNFIGLETLHLTLKIY